jgi:hypothetical protein
MRLKEEQAAARRLLAHRPQILPLSQALALLARLCRHPSRVCVVVSARSCPIALHPSIPEHCLRLYPRCRFQAGGAPPYIGTN